MKKPHTNSVWSRSAAGIAVALFLLLCTSCSVHTHRVGGGSTGTREESARQWYVFFGLWRLNEVNTQRMTGELTSYDIRTALEGSDLFLSALFLPLTVTTRTVTVYR